MSRLGHSARTAGTLAISALVGSAFACNGTGPTSPPAPSGTITISPTQTSSPPALSAAFSDQSITGRYVINPSVTFSAGNTDVSVVREVRFSFVVDADRVIEQGAFLVHGGDLRRGPVTQQYPLAFDIGVHFPNLRVQLRATFVKESGTEILSQAAEAPIQLPVARP